MNSPEEAPKLPLLPFLVGDILLVITAAVIATRGATPLGAYELLAITICVVFGAALAVVPFLANYARRQDAELADRQNQIAALARTTADSAEQLGIAAAGLHGIAESSKHNLDALSKLPAKIQERIDGVTQQLAGSALAAQAPLKDDLAQLSATAEKITRALAKLDAAAHAQVETLASREREFAAALARATAQIDSLVANAVTHAVRIADAPPSEEPPKSKAPKPKARPAPSIDESITEVAPPASVVPEPLPAPAPAAIESSAPLPEPAAVAPEPEPAPAHQPEPARFAPSEPDADEVPVSDPEPPKPARARKPKPEDDIPDLGLTPDPADAPETALTSDGFTRLIATAYIGIGNKLYIRGDGPGLSWEKGVPLQFVSIGKWRWETPDATAPLRVKLYKNDQVECVGLGELTLQPAHQHEVNAGF